MVVEAANAGPNKDTSALITAIESVAAAIGTFAEKNFNMTQFRTNNGGVEIGTVAIDASGNITARSYDPGAIMWTQGTYFNGGTMLASGTHEDPSGTFFTVTAQTDAIPGLPKGSSKILILPPPERTPRSITKSRTHRCKGRELRVWKSALPSKQRPASA